MSPQNEQEGTRPKMIRRIKRFALLFAGVAVVVVASGMMVRLNATNEEQNFSTEQAVPSVAVVHPGVSKGGGTLTLPGSLQAYYAAPIYARVPGYVRIWNKDIGGRVRRGEVLAEIDTPEVDQQIAQARADLANAEAAKKQSASTAKRWTNLLKIGGVSKEDAEEKTSDLAVKTAQVNSAKANLDRLLTMKTFAHIIAPFDGVITERTIDIGNLVNAGAGSAGSSLFTVADTHKMRVYVRVPQNYSAQIRDHLKATLSLPEYPGESFAAELVSTSDAISNQSNTLLVQLAAENSNGKLKAGAYAEVNLQLPAGTQNLSIPVSTLLFRADGLHVATVGENDRVIMKPIKIATDLGTTVEVNSGLTASDKVIDNPPDSLESGDLVRVSDGPIDR
jgi:membrane fusion protein, multidrug efflux system